MNVTKPNKPAAVAGFGAVLLLAGVLAVLFWRSFLPDYVHFSNDGPLGQQNAAWARLPAGFWSVWADNNDLGTGVGLYPFATYAWFNWLMGPVGYAKFLAPFELFILGLGAWTFFRQLKLTPLAATLGALAAALNSTFFATACWGVAAQEGAVGWVFFALALVVSSRPELAWWSRLARLVLAGLLVGINVIEASDIGAIFSVFASGFIVANALNRESGPVVAKISKGVGQVILVAAFAGLIAAQSLVSLVGTQIQGIAGAAQDAETKAEKWDWATTWSLPKVETLSFVVPGLFGYKMDTPQGMDPNYADHYNGGMYWGAMGLDPRWDHYLASGSKESPPVVQMRQTGGGGYAGVLVVFVAVWAAAQALRKKDSVFSDPQRRLVWFWSAVVILSVLFAWGRFSVFYALLYKLPYVSTIRSPTKFIIVFSWAIVVLFAYGLDGLSRRYLPVNDNPPVNLAVQLKKWWRTISGFDRNWVRGSLVAVGISLLAWLVYAGEKPALIHYLQRAPGDQAGGLAKEIADHSISAAGVFVVLLALVVGLWTLILSGALAGRRAKWGGLFLGLVLVADLGRANLPYIVHWDYKLKYDIDPNNPAVSTNPILNFLRDKSYEHRVAQLPFRIPENMEDGPLFEQLYTIEWMQHQYPYFNIQALDNWQRPRVGSDIAIYESTVYAGGAAGFIRQWQLTNTRYLIGPAGFLESLNTQIDPDQHRFNIALRFRLAPKPGILHPTKLIEITAVPDTNGDFAVFEFTGALPRAKLYGNWQVNTNDAAVLQTLVRPDFDPAQTVMVDTPAAGLAPGATNANAGTVEYKNYLPADITLAANAPVPSVLLLNDKYDPYWTATVDGRPAPVLKCNFIMRGVALDAGSHVVEFKYNFPHQFLYVTMAGFGLAVLLAFYVFLDSRSRRAA